MRFFGLFLDKAFDLFWKGYKVTGEDVAFFCIRSANPELKMQVRARFASGSYRIFSTAKMNINAEVENQAPYTPPGGQPSRPLVHHRGASWLPFRIFTSDLRYVLYAARTQRSMELPYR